MGVQSPRSRVQRRAGGAPKASPVPRSRKLPELDRVIHERMRLAIVSALAANEVLSFNEMKALLGTSDGNLSVHARRLEEAGYLACVKSFEARIPKTEYRLTSEGGRPWSAT